MSVVSKAEYAAPTPARPSPESQVETNGWTTAEVQDFEDLLAVRGKAFDEFEPVVCRKIFKRTSFDTDKSIWLCSRVLCSIRLPPSLLFMSLAFLRAHSIQLPARSLAEIVHFYYKVGVYVLLRVRSYETVGYIHRLKKP